MADRDAGEALLLGLIDSKQFPESFSEDQLEDIVAFLDAVYEGYAEGGEIEEVMMNHFPQALREQIADQMQLIKNEEDAEIAKLEAAIEHAGRELDQMLNEDGES